MIVAGLEQIYGIEKVENKPPMVNPMICGLDKNDVRSHADVSGA